ncbi:MAG: AmmeMemoRadiSam system protein B [Thermodesulfobacteriota bacterium]
MVYPKLIAVDTFPVEEDGRKMYCIKDPQNSDIAPLVVSELALYIMTFFDGNNSIDSVIATLKEKYGKVIEKADLDSLVKMLDTSLLLENENYINHQQLIENNFFNSDTRKAYLSGLSYPESKEKLNNMLDDFFEKAGNILPLKNENEILRGLVSPHIDFTRGGTSYAVAYREIINKSNANTYLIFGTTHYAQNDNPFILTRKPFSTPLGTIDTDTEFLDRIEDKCKWDLYEGEIFHRTEHSIEFQVVFLQHILKEKNFKIIPVLCNSFHQFIGNGSSPFEDKKISTFLTELKKIINSYGDSVVVIAGVDLAHVGPKFGDKDQVDEKTLSWIRNRDAISLEYTEKIDAEGFYRSVEEEKDKRKICGLSSIYSMLKVTDASYGTILDYDNALEEDTGSVVTFASAGYYKGGI